MNLYTSYLTRLEAQKISKDTKSAVAKFRYCPGNISTSFTKSSKMSCHIDGNYESKEKFNDLAPIRIELQIQTSNHCRAIYDFTLTLPLQIFTLIQTNSNQLQSKKL